LLQDREFFVGQECGIHVTGIEVNANGPLFAISSVDGRAIGETPSARESFAPATQRRPLRNAIGIFPTER
jgi:hypothetical protein